MSEWQPIETAPKDGRTWLVSDTGQITVNGRTIAQHTNNKGYLKAVIGEKTVFVHRIVAMAFVQNPDKKPEVNHKNGIKSDNNFLNLEWCSRSENMKHAYSSGLHCGVRLCGEDSPNWKRNGDRHPQSMPVRAIFPDGTCRDYASQKLAEEDGFSSSKISRCISGLNKTHLGCIWMPLPAPPAP